MRIKYLFYGAIALLFVSTAYTEDWVSPERLRANIAERTEAAGIHGLAYAVIRNGKARIIETFGVDGNNSPINRNSPFRVGELSAVPTSILLLRLIEQQQLALNTRVAPNLGINNPFNRVFPLKLEHLLSQTSGLPRSSYKAYKGYDIDINPSQITQVEAAALAVLRPPGEHYLASDLDFTVAAAVAEHRTNTPFDDLVNDLVLLPLVMHSTGYSNISSANALDSFSANGERAPFWKTSLRPSLGMHSTIEDMARLTEYLAAPELVPSILKPDTFSQLFTSNAAAARAGYPLHPGKGIKPFISAGHLFWGGTGQIDGFYASLGILRDSGDGFVLLANSHQSRDLRLIREALAHYASQRVTLPELPDEATLDHSQHQGWWVPVGQKSALSQWLWAIAGHIYLTASDDGLKITQLMPGVDLRQLVAINPNQYRPLRSDQAILQFFTHNGEAFLISGNLEVYRQLSFVKLLPQLLLTVLITITVGGGLIMGLLTLPLSLSRVLSNQYSILSHWLLGVASLCGVTAIGLFLRHDLSDSFSLHYTLGSINLLSVSLAALTSLWSLLIIGNIYLLWSRGKKFPNTAYRWSVCASIGHAVLLMYLATNNWLPLLTWQY